jgi:hypothetical protein
MDKGFLLNKHVEVYKRDRDGDTNENTAGGATAERLAQAARADQPGLTQRSPDATLLAGHQSASGTLPPLEITNSTVTNPQDINSAVFGHETGH